MGKQRNQQNTEEKKSSRHLGVYLSDDDLFQWKCHCFEVYGIRPSDFAKAAIREKIEKMEQHPICQSPLSQIELNNSILSRITQLEKYFRNLSELPETPETPELSEPSNEDDFLKQVENMGW
jgi:hypothetical protein